MGTNTNWGLPQKQLTPQEFISGTTGGLQAGWTAPAEQTQTDFNGVFDEEEYIPFYRQPSIPNEIVQERVNQARPLMKDEIHKALQGKKVTLAEGKNVAEDIGRRFGPQNDMERQAFTAEAAKYIADNFVKKDLEERERNIEAFGKGTQSGLAGTLSELKRQQMIKDITGVDVTLKGEQAAKDKALAIERQNKLEAEQRTYQAEIETKDFDLKQAQKILARKQKALAVNPKDLTLQTAVEDAEDQRDKIEFELNRAKKQYAALSSFPKQETTTTATNAPSMTQPATAPKYIRLPNGSKKLITPALQKFVNNLPAGYTLE